MTEKEIREKAEETVLKMDNDWSNAHEVVETALAAAHRQGREEQKQETLAVTKCGLDSDACAHPECDASDKRECLFYRRAMNDVAHSLLSRPDGSGGEGKTI